MKPKKPIIPAKLLMPVGLLLVVLPLLLNDIFKLPDFLRGLFMGVGIVLEIAGFVIQKKEARSKCKTAGSES